MQGARDGAVVHRQSQVKATAAMVAVPVNLQLSRLNSNEDWFASRYLVGPFRALRSLLTNTEGAIAPEVQMIGFVMGFEPPVTGKMDDVKLGRDGKTLVINDVKTLSTTDLPSNAEQKYIKLQLFLYLPLLRDFLAGNLALDKLGGTYDFDPEKGFSRCFQDVKAVLFDIPDKSIRELYGALVESLKELPKEIGLTVEYKLRLPEDEPKTLRTELLKYDEKQLKDKMTSFFAGHSKGSGHRKQTLMTSFFGSNKKQKTE
ncbi:hypothetical protein RvY_15498 [Ramazzottius varieornatus]|uniref:Uncharacterized protein n=1 Tax=Ramazzottius varieornatus TaxID=947166 RepID=A0A1D1VV68_RAMVA|nr:hypothetical protein RvY_15498 [Ramazzottius varieornatus]